MLNYVWTQFGVTSSGLGALGINFSSFLIQLATFILAILLLQRFAFKPIIKVLRDRRDLIEKGVQLGDQLIRQQTELDKKVSASLHEARRQADLIIARAEEIGQQSIQAAEIKAAEQAKIFLDEARKQIVQETSRARRRLESEIVELISVATEVIIDEKVDENKDARLIDRALRGERKI